MYTLVRAGFSNAKQRLDPGTMPSLQASRFAAKQGCGIE